MRRRTVNENAFCGICGGIPGIKVAGGPLGGLFVDFFVNIAPMDNKKFSTRKKKLKDCAK